MLTIVVEGISDEAIVRKLCLIAQVAVGSVYIQRGKDQLDKRIAGYNAAAQYALWLVVRDLNSDAEWNPEVAATHADSLNRCLSTLSQIAADLGG